MNIQQIREKYKEILEESDSQNSEDQWQIAYSRMTQKRKKKILTQTNIENKVPYKTVSFEKNSIRKLSGSLPHQNNQSSRENKNNKEDIDVIVIPLKEKLAQSLLNLQIKNKEIINLNHQIQQGLSQKGELEQQIKKQSDLIAIKQSHISQQNIVIKKLQKQNTEIKHQMQVCQMDKELIQKQIQYYKHEIFQIKDKFNTKIQEISAMSKSIRQVNKIQSQNCRLKDDLCRLNNVISECTRFGKISHQLMKRHFISGKPFKEIDYWYDVHLVGEVQLFLKKTQVGYGNKEFTDYLIKFIDKCVKRQKQKGKEQRERQRAKYKSISRGKQGKQIDIEAQKYMEKDKRKQNRNKQYLQNTHKCKNTFNTQKQHKRSLSIKQNDRSIERIHQVQQPNNNLSKLRKMKNLNSININNNIHHNISNSNKVNPQNNRQKNNNNERYKSAVKLQEYHQQPQKNTFVFNESICSYCQEQQQSYSSSSNTSQYIKQQESIKHINHVKQQLVKSIKRDIYAILYQFKELIQDLMFEKQIRRKKIIKIVSSMINTVLDSLKQEQKHQSNDANGDTTMSKSKSKWNTSNKWMTKSACKTHNVCMADDTLKRKYTTLEREDMLSSQSNNRYKKFK